MLRITQQDNSQAAKKYYSGADYYLQESIGLWGGKGAKLLGLENEVDKQSFERMCDNLDPRNGQRLTARTRADRTVGYDFTFSVPKSVSLLHALSDDKGMLDAFRSAVAETMTDIEAEMKTRVRRGGQDNERVTGNMVWAEFIHTTSRPVDGVPDPQLHSHVFAFGTWDEKEQQWKAGQYRDIKRDAPYFQAMFRVRLANKLQDLGFGITRTRDDFEIAGVPAHILKRFSRRTEFIEQKAREDGITDPKRKAELGQETREKKSNSLSLDELRRLWVERLSGDEYGDLSDVYRRDAAYARPVREEGKAVDHALEHCFVKESVVPERKLLTEALKRGVGAVTIEGVKRELAGRKLLRGEQGGRMLATTDEMLQLESRIVAFARDGRGRCRPLGDPERPCLRDWFNAGQKKAVKHVLGSRDKVTMIRGVAGSGKTTLEAEIGEALREAGVPVVALAQSLEASRDVLRNEAGFADADTVARFFVDKNMQASARGGLILVDEASQLGTRDMAKLFAMSEELGSRILLVGDIAQHRSVSAGEPLRLLQKKAGLPVAEVKEILRQSGAYKQAAKAVSEGRIEEGFGTLDQLGWIREVPDATRYQTLADAYLAATREKKSNGKFKEALVITPTHAEGARVTGAIRQALKQKDKYGRSSLAGDDKQVDTWRPVHLTDAEKADRTNYEVGDVLKFHQNTPGHRAGSRLAVTEDTKLPLEFAGRFQVFRPMQVVLAVGERIRMTANNRDKSGKHRLDNGSFRTVRGFTPQGEIIIDDRIVLGKDAAITLGYSVTSHAAQGKTVDKVFIAESAQSFPAANTRQFYVSMSRGREQAVIFTDKKQELLEAVTRRDQPLGALEFKALLHRRPPLRQRLQRHLSFLRRVATFSRIHEARQPEPQKTLQQERMSHDR